MRINKESVQKYRYGKILSLTKKCFHNMARLDKMKKDAHDFGIKLSAEQLKEIDEKWKLQVRRLHFLNGEDFRRRQEGATPKNRIRRSSKNVSPEIKEQVRQAIAARKTQYKEGSLQKLLGAKLVLQKSESYSHIDNTQIIETRTAVSATEIAWAEGCLEGIQMAIEKMPKQMPSIDNASGSALAVLNSLNCIQSNFQSHLSKLRTTNNI